MKSPFFFIPRFLPLAFAAALFTGCGKKEDPEPRVQITQFIEFDADQQHFNWTESDSIEFQPVYGFSTTTANPDSLVFNFFVNIRKEHKNNDQSSWYEGITLVFNRKWAHNATVVNPDGCRTMTPATKFGELFSPASWNLEGAACQEHIHDRAILMDANIVYEEDLVAGGTAWDTDCDLLPLEQQGSTFTVDTAEDYVDPVYGETIMISGTFQLKLYTSQGVVQVSNGKYRVLVNECN